MTEAIETVIEPKTEPKKILSHNNTMTISVLKEFDSQENRVALSPEAVSILVKNDILVLVEKNAGAKSNFDDSDYLLAGAKIVENRADLFETNILVKINPLNPLELVLLKRNTLLISALQSKIQDAEYLRVLLEKKITQVSFEHFEDKMAEKTVVRAMSEIAGSAVLLIATEYLSSVNAGKGIVLGGITGLPPANVLILGAGTVAEYASRSALGLGANVKVFDNEIYRLKRLQNVLGQRIYTSLIDESNLNAAVLEADVIIGALKNTQGYKISEELISGMKDNSVIIDVSIDQGGCFETSKPTSHYAPVYKLHGVVHYCVPNIPSRFAHSASLALSNIFLPFLLQVLREGGITNAMYTFPWYKNAVICHQGAITNIHIAKSCNLKFRDLGLGTTAIN